LWLQSGSHTLNVSMIAFTREVSPSIERCELTHLARVPIDLDRARLQHRAYEDALRQAGCHVHRLPDEPVLPDAVFVSDTAVILDEVGVIARPGAESRRAEVTTVANALSRHRPLRHIEAPGTLDGGDVIRIGHIVYVGQSARTNAAGIRQMEALLQRVKYAVRPVQFAGCLHLQTAVTPVAARAVLVNRTWVNPAAFGDVEVIDVDPSEPFAANALLVGDVVLHPADCPRTRARLKARGITVVPVDISELAKAEAGVTCCCLHVPAVE
jgi:dimethylargininase